jgi:hypothetical protein
LKFVCIIHGVDNDVECLELDQKSDIDQITHVHVLVELSTVDDLPGDLDVVMVKVLLDLVLVDGVNDWRLVKPQQMRVGVEGERHLDRVSGVKE